MPEDNEKVMLVVRFTVSKEMVDEVRGQIEDFARDFLDDADASLESIEEESTQ